MRHSVRRYVFYDVCHCSGSGQQMALLFAKRGAIVVLCDINEAGNAQTTDLIAKELTSMNHNDHRVFSYTCDIGNRNEVQLLVERIQNEVGEITMLVNNGLLDCRHALEPTALLSFLCLAAILSSKSIMEMTEEEFSRCLDVDLFACYWVRSQSIYDR